MLKSTSNIKKWCSKGIVILTFLTIGISPAIAFDKVSKSRSGVAIRGLDPVAFQTEKRAVKGKKEFSTLKNYVFPIGTVKPAIILPEVKIQ